MENKRHFKIAEELSRQICLHAPTNLHSRIYADLIDITLECERYLKKCEQVEGVVLSDDELLAFIVDFDVCVLGHIFTHIVSTKSYIQELIDSVKTEEDS